MDLIELLLKGYYGIFFGIIGLYFLIMGVLSIISYFV
jgi:hypothetical protein